MLNEKELKWIDRQVHGHYSEDMEQSLEALCCFLKLQQTELLPFEKAIVRMASADDEEKVALIQQFGNIEGFVKHLCRMVKPGAMDKPPKDPKFTSWTLAPIYKEVFKVIPQEVHLTYAKPSNFKKEIDGKKYIDHFIRMYHFRNDTAHVDEMELGPENVMLVIRSMMIVMLYLCYSYRRVLLDKAAAKHRKEIFDREAFAQKIIANYKQAEKDGFCYLNTCWYSDDLGKRSTLPVNDILSDGKNSQLKLLGEAGCGKSTALRRIEYLLAQQVAAGDEKATVPVFVELLTLSDGNSILRTALAELMDIDDSEIEGFLENGEVFLLLDGFNEILAKDVKAKTAKELDNLVRSYPELRIILTDRARTRAAVPTMVGARCRYAYPINDENRKEYFLNNCKDPEAKNLLLEEMKAKPGAFDKYNSPLKLKQLIMVVEGTHQIPPKYPMPTFVSYLMERERNEKKDENIEYLPDFLKALALALEENEDAEGIPQKKAVRQIKYVMDAYGYNTPDSLNCLRLAVDMGLMTENNEIYCFASEELQEYFLNEADADDMLEDVEIVSISGGKAGH